MVDFNKRLKSASKQGGFMSKELAKQETGSRLPAQAQNQSDGEVLKTDIIIPFVVLGQGLSDAVTEKKVEMGDIYRSTSREVLGSPTKPIEAIFLHCPKPDWVIEQKPKGAQKFEYRKAVPRNASNETLPWQYWADDDGVEMEPGAKGATEWRRVKRLTVMAILPADIEAQQAEMAKVEAGDLPDPSKALTPVMFSFRSSSYDAGKRLITFFSKAKSLGAQLHRYQLTLFDALEKNDQGAFYVWGIEDAKPKAVPKDLLPYVQQWIELIGAGTNFNVHEEGESEAFAAPTERVVNERAAKDVC